MGREERCEFQLIRYVPDPVKNEFVNIGVVLRAGDQKVLRFTRDWSRVRCLDPDADTEMLKALELEVGQRLQTETAEPREPARPILGRFEDSLSNGVQITQSKAYLAETIAAGVEELMRLYVENPRREKVQARKGRSAVVAAMRSQFEKAGVWMLMRKNIAASLYTAAGDPLRIDCGYKNGGMKMFQAISLETDASDAKLLAYSAAGLRQGIRRVENTQLELTAILDPILWPEGDGEPSEESRQRYDYANHILQEHEIRVLTTSDLPRLAQAARLDLQV
jgi:hypothetical protein